MKYVFLLLALFMTAKVAKAQNTCPDANHPHAIDLGLPSGLKWACCNVKASTPFDKGQFYAWGKTNEKDASVDVVTSYYEVGDWEERTVEVKNIIPELGFDIAGTGYDITTSEMGTQWFMPSLEQFGELLNKNNTTVSVLKKNGDYYVQITGNNQNSLLLPVVYRKDNNCGYWTSTLFTSTEKHDGQGTIIFSLIDSKTSYYLGISPTTERKFGFMNTDIVNQKMVRAVCH